MRVSSKFSPIVIMIIVLLLEGCSDTTATRDTPVSATAVQPTSSPLPLASSGSTVIPSSTLPLLTHATPRVVLTTSPTLRVTDYNSLLTNLEMGGATVSAGNTVEQPFLSMTGRSMNVDGESIQVFLFPNAMQIDQIVKNMTADGRSIQTASGGAIAAEWLVPPHFYKKGRLLVLYLGSTSTVINILQTILGHQFAGEVNTSSTAVAGTVQGTRSSAITIRQSINLVPLFDLRSALSLVMKGSNVPQAARSISSDNPRFKGIITALDSQVTTTPIPDKIPTEEPTSVTFVFSAEKYVTFRFDRQDSTLISDAFGGFQVPAPANFAQILGLS